MYRFLWSRRWIGLGLLMALAAATMVGLGLWQLARFQSRSAINERIDMASSNPPQPLAEVLTPPTTGRVGPAPPADQTWSLVTVTGRFDQTYEVIARARTVNETVGYEIITPLILADGTAILVDRGWVAAGDGGASRAPWIAPAPLEDVTVIGRVHAPESRATAAEPFDGHVAVRRVSPEALAPAMPYPLYGAYLTMETQVPAADPGFVAIPPDLENATMNAGYVVQWWAFAALTLFGYGYLVYREAHPTSSSTEDDPTDDDPDLEVGGVGEGPDSAERVGLRG